MIIQGRKKQVLTQILGDVEGEGKDTLSPLHSCMQELIDAVHDKDIEGAVAAFRACFATLEAEPHDEYPHGE